MIIEKLLNKDLLTENEKSIAAYILDRNNDIENLTSLELGEHSYTSQAAVIRLYKKLGLKSYREFLSKIVIERNEYFKLREIDKDTLANYLDTHSDVSGTISKLYTQTMIQTNVLIDQNAVSRICNRIIHAQMIDIYGVGISETLAKQMVFQLQSLGLNCCYHDGINNNYIKNSSHNKRVAILITLTGINETIYHIAKK